MNVYGFSDQPLYIHIEAWVLTIDVLHITDVHTYSIDWCTAQLNMNRITDVRE